MKKCKPVPNAEYFSKIADRDLQDALAAHADPAWWKQEHIQRVNQAYLRRWGSMLRREARKRGLL